MFLGGNGLPARWHNCETFHIAELGFGTGLNFLETWRQWRETRGLRQQLIFTSFEAYPLEANAIKRAISCWPELAEFSLALLEHWPQLTTSPQTWALDEQTHLQIINADATEGLRTWSRKADAWYLDGFSPQQNPLMWSAELMGEVFVHTNPDGTFATYTSAGWVRRNLIEAGFNVEKTKGHANKRHMLVGRKIAGG